MPNNAGKGRQKGSRNKITEATLALAKSGESPLELMLRVAQDTESHIGAEIERCPLGGALCAS